MDGHGGNAVSQRSTAVLSVASITAASVLDVTWANNSARFGGTASPLLTDRVIVNPAAAPAGLTGISAAFVSAASVITARFTNPGAASVAAQTVTVNVQLIKSTGSI